MVDHRVPDVELSVYTGISLSFVSIAGVAYRPHVVAGDNAVAEPLPQLIDP